VSDGAVPPVYIEFKGDVKGLESAIKSAVGSLKGFQNEADNTGKSAKGMSVGTVAAGTAIGYMMVGLAEKVKGFATEFFTDFKNMASETKKLQRTMGGTTEEISGLIFASNKFGVTTDGLSRGIQTLSRNVIGNSKATQNLGFSVKDTNGKFLPTIDILKGISDQYSKMPAGLERNAYLTGIMGKSAAQLAPLFALGTKGITELTAESKRLGIQISGADLDALKQYTNANKALKETVDSVKISIGRQLLPVFTQQLVYMGAGVKMISDWAMAHKEGLMQAAKAALIFAVAIITVQGVTSGAQTAIDAFNGVLQAGSIMWGVITGATFWYIIAIGAVVAAISWAMANFEPFHDFMLTILQAVGTYWGTFAKYVLLALRVVVMGWFAAIKVILTGAKLLAPVLAKVGINWFDSAGGMLNTVTKMGDNIAGSLESTALKMPVLGKKIGKGIANGLTAAGNFDIKSAINKIVKMFETNVAGSDLKKILDTVNTTASQTVDNAAATAGNARSAAAAAGITGAELVKNVKEYWDGVVEAAKAAKDLSVASYEKARDLMKSAYSGLGSILDVTKLTASSNTTADVVAYFRDKLTSIKEFVANLRILQSAGLNSTMMAQLVAAGPEGGASAARLLAGDLSSISQLNEAQSEFIEVASGAATLFGGDNTVENYVSSANDGSAEANYNAAVAGRDAAVAEANQYNDITINMYGANASNADDVADQIANAVAAGIKSKPAAAKPKAYKSVKPTPAPGPRLAIPRGS
jgi:SepF-like predicted cell division protein (DUF552 family)